MGRFEFFELFEFFEFFELFKWWFFGRGPRYDLNSEADLNYLNRGSEFKEFKSIKEKEEATPFK